MIHLKIEKIDISSLSPLKLSEFVDSVRYLQLKTTNECLLPYYGTSMDTHHVENYLFVGDLYFILKFDATNGKFLGNIGSRGQGPGEYTQIQNMCIDTDNKRIIVKEHSKLNLMTYSYEGEYLSPINLEKMEEARFTTCYYSLSLKDIDSQYMIFSAEIKPIEYACQPYEVIIYDYKNQMVLHTSPNLMNGTYEYYSAKINGVRAFTKYDNMLYHKSFYNDTLYSIHKEKGINPFAVIDLNGRKLPNEVFLSRDEYFKKIWKNINKRYLYQPKLYTFRVLFTLRIRK